MKQQNSLMHTAVVALVAGTLGAGLMVSFQAWATYDDDTVDAVPRAFPYNGVLEIDGIPRNTPVDLRFDIFEGENGDTILETVSISGVRVTAGNFSTMIESDNLEELFATASQFCFEVSVDVGDGEGMRPLSGRQCIGAVPYAMWAANATNFNITSTLDVGGAATVNGRLTVEEHAYVSQDAMVDGNLYLRDRTGTGSIFAFDGDMDIYLDDGGNDNVDSFEVRHNSNDALLFQVHENNGGFIEGDLHVTGELQVDGNHLTSEVELYYRVDGIEGRTTICTFPDTGRQDLISGDRYCELESASEYICYITQLTSDSDSCRLRIAGDPAVWRLQTDGGDSSGCRARCFAYKTGE